MSMAVAPIAVVTGASRGIGRAIALELARRGFDLFVHAGHSTARAEEVVAHVQRFGRRAQSMVNDIAVLDGHEQLVAAAWDWQRRPVDVWVNNAGADVLTGPAAQWTYHDKLQRLWEVDVRGTMGLARLAGARMKEAGRGAIINIGWDQADVGMAGDSGEIFAAIKGAIAAFSKSLAKSLAPEVRVNCVAPGWIKTAWGESAPEYWAARARGESLLGRWGTPEDVARAVGFLVSQDGEFINGQVLAINGGLQPWPREHGATRSHG